MNDWGVELNARPPLIISIQLEFDSTTNGVQMGVLKTGSISYSVMLLFSPLLSRRKLNFALTLAQLFKVESSGLCSGSWHHNILKYIRSSK